MNLRFKLLSRLRLVCGITVMVCCAFLLASGILLLLFRDIAVGGNAGPGVILLIIWAVVILVASLIQRDGSTRSNDIFMISTEPSLLRRILDYVAKSAAIAALLGLVWYVVVPRF
jgi:hypothetical protein